MAFLLPAYAMAFCSGVANDDLDLFTGTQSKANQLGQRGKEFTVSNSVYSTKLRVVKW